VFDPENRTSLTELLAPPPGYAVEAAFATTYCLDFAAFASTCIALTGNEVGESGRSLTRGELLRAFTRLSKRLLIVTNQGMVDFDADGRRRRLGALLGQCIAAVGSSSSAFHPKVWVLKYVPSSAHGSPLYRVICSSRNLTRTRSWETSLVLEGRTAVGHNAFGRSLGLFMASVTKTSTRTGGAVANLQRELSRVRFEGRADVRFLWQQTHGSAKLWKQLPKHIDSAIVVAPFVENVFIDAIRRDLDRGDGRIKLVSRQRALDRLDAVHRDWCRHHAFALLAGIDETYAQELHAKLFLWQSGPGGGVFVGSANATGAAWGLTQNSNWEAMIALEQPDALERFEREFMYVSRRSKTLRPWLIPYEPSAAGAEDETPEETLDRYRQRLGALDLGARWRPDSPGSDLGTLSFAMAAQSKWALQSLARDSRVTCKIGWIRLAQSDDPTDLQPLERLLAGPVQFKGVPRTELSELALIQMKLANAHPSEKYIVILNRVDFPARWRERRDHAVIDAALHGQSMGATLLEMLRGFSYSDENDASKHTPGAGSGSRTAVSDNRVRYGYLEMLLDRCATDATALTDVEGTLAAFDPKAGEVVALRTLIENIKRVAP
jgi:hypothetical protein